MTRDPVIRELCKIPNVGPSIAEDLVRLGITSLDQLAPRDPYELYNELCLKDAVRYDPCLLDTFIAITAIARGEPARPWWHFTPARKARLNAKG